MKTVKLKQMKIFLFSTVMLANVCLLNAQTNTEDDKQEKIVIGLINGFRISADEVLQYFDKDAVIEYPYAYSLKTPSKLNKIEYSTYLKNALSKMGNFEVSNILVYKAKHNILWAEFHGETIIPGNANSYKQDYVVRITLKEDKIINYKEYWNPAAATSFGNNKEVNAIFNEKTKQ